MLLDDCVNIPNRLQVFSHVSSKCAFDLDMLYFAVVNITVLLLRSTRTVAGCLAPVNSFWNNIHCIYLCIHMHTHTHTHTHLDFCNEEPLDHPSDDDDDATTPLNTTKAKSN